MKQRALGWLPLILSLGSCLGACRQVSQTPEPGPQTSVDAPAAESALSTAALAENPPTIELADDWDDSTLQDFEEWVQQTPAVFLLPPSSSHQLAEALRDPGLRALRAAIVLGRSGTQNEALFGLLERRLTSTARADDASAVVCAAALAKCSDPALPRSVVVTRLNALCVGPFAHPDLEVRVQCAASSLELSSRVAVPFLLSVLRIDTWEGRQDRLDYEPSSTTAWPRETAANALYRELKIEPSYRSDASIEERQASAQILAERFGVTLPITLTR